jgi:hypothetical protein
MRRFLPLAAAALLLSLFGVPQANASESLQSRIYGGVAVPGNPTAVALSIFDGRFWSGSCTAAMWKPRLLITNAHCVTVQGSNAIAPGITVFPPGGAAVRFANFLEGQSSANVIGVWLPSTYVNSSQTVEPNDIAVLVLDTDLAPAGFTRLATTDEATRWAAQNIPVEHVGYGLTGPRVTTTVPNAITLPLLTFNANSPIGSTFRTAQNASQGICPGDSGSPVFRVNELGNLLIGVIAGGRAACISPTQSNPANVGFAASGYIPMLNEGLRSVGYPTMPSAPINISQQARNRDITVTWEPPQTSPETVIEYHVVDGNGTVVCASEATSCTISGLPDASYSFTVRARNAQDEGDATPAPLDRLSVIAPPQQMQPPTVRANERGNIRVRFLTSIGASSAAVTQYVVRNNANKVVCRIDANSDGTPEPQSRACTVKLEKKGTYRFRVLARTEMGNSPVSGLSNRVRVR